MKLSHKISYLYLAVFISVLIFFGFGLYIVSSNIIRNNAFDHLETASELTAFNIETYLEGDLDKLKLITSRTKLRNTLKGYNQSFNPDDVKVMQDILIDAKESSPEIERICVANLEGKIIVSTNNDFIGRDISELDLFLNGRVKNGVRIKLDNGETKLFFSGPIYLEDELIGVGISVEKASDLIEIVNNRAGLGETGENLIAFNDGGKPFLINTRRFESDLVEDFENKEFLPMRDVLENKNSNHGVQYLNVQDYRDERVIAITHHIELGDLGLVSKIDMDQILNPVRQNLLFFVFLGFLVSFIVYFISRILAKKITQPIVELQQGVEKIEKGVLDYKVGKSTKDEIGQLSRSFERMVSSIKASKQDIEKKVHDRTKALEQSQKAMLNVLEDVEKEKELNKRQAEDLKKFKLAVDSASDHIVITDKEGIVLYGNKMVTKITGYSMEEVLGKKAGVLWRLPMSKEFYERLWDTIKNKKQVFSGEIQNKRKNGEVYDARVSISPVLNDEGEVVFFVGIERDITKEKQVDRAKTEFVSLASHQLRTPLSAINWYAEMLLSGDAGKLTDDQVSYLTEIYKGNQRMVSLVNSLLNVSRLELGTFAINPKEINPIEVLKLVLKENKPILEAKKINLNNQIDENLPTFSADTELLTMIFQNLISNAIKYSPVESQITISLKLIKTGIEFGRKKFDFDAIGFSVKDQGMGIPENQRDQIFKKLFRADNARAGSAEGTGLGLYIIKSIVDNIKGQIWFESKENEGSEFFVIIPRSGMEARQGDKKLN